MATIDSIQGRKYFNVSYPVGPINSPNISQDVMVVQELMLAINNFSDWTVDLPPPNGIFDKRTANAIKEFQRFAQDDWVYDISQDGRVSRALAKKKWSGNTYWTIIALNDIASFYIKRRGLGESSVEFMMKWSPNLQKIFKQYQGSIQR